METTTKDKRRLCERISLKYKALGSPTLYFMCITLKKNQNDVINATKLSQLTEENLRNVRSILSKLKGLDIVNYIPGEGYRIISDDVNAILDNDIRTYGV